MMRNRWIAFLLPMIVISCHFRSSVASIQARRHSGLCFVNSAKTAARQIATKQQQQRQFGSSSSSSSSLLQGSNDNNSDGSSTATPLERVIRLRGPVDTGYGRGGKKLGFPTANLPSSLFADALQDVSTGVYMGWAMIEGKPSSNDDTDDGNDGRNVPHKAAVNVGYSPTFEGQENKEKIVEAHLILEEPMTDFYQETMRLSLVGFLRPEQKFDSFPQLVQAITNDVANSKKDLDTEPYQSFCAESPFMTTTAAATWIGSSGGDEHASWEFQDWNDAIQS